MAFKRYSIGTKGPKVCQENIPHTITPPPPAWTVETRQDPCFHVLYAKFWPYHLNVAAEIETHQTRQCFYNLLLSNFGDPVWIVPVFSWQERHPVWSSAVVAHLLQGSMCCAFRDDILHSLVVTSDYLSYCCLSIIFNPSAHFPLTSTRHFRPHNCRSLDIFFFFGPFSVNSRDGCAWKSQ